MDDNINEEDDEEAVKVLEHSNENKDNNVDALELEEDREMGDVEEVHVNKHMTDGTQLAKAPDEVRLCNLKEMTEEAYKLIPDIGQESMSLDEDDKDSRSIKLEDTQELMEKIQQQSRQLVAFDNYVDANKSLDNDNDAEDDEYMLKILHEKRLESTSEFSADGSSVFAPIGVFAEYGEVAPSRFVGRKRTNKERKVQETEKATLKKPRNITATSTETTGAAGKMRIPKQPSTSGAKKGSAKAKSTPKQSAKSTSAKRSLTRTISKKPSVKIGAAATRRSPQK